MTKMVVGDLPRVNAARAATAPAFLDTNRVWTWAEVEARVNALAHGLREEAGLRPGDVVAVLSANRVECLEVMFAASRAGVVHTALKTRAHAKEMLRQIDDAGPRLLIVGPGFEEKAAVIRAERGDIGLFGLSEAGIGDDYEALLAQASAEPVESHEDPDAVYSIMYTSGSTGEPKGVAVASRNELAYAWAYSWAVEARPDDVFQCVLPLEHRGGQAYAMMSALLGCPTVLAAPDPLVMLEVIGRQGVTVTAVVPTMARIMVEALESAPDRFDVSCLRRIMVGSAPVSPDLACRLLKATSAKLCQAAGNSEGAPSTILTTVDYDQVTSDPTVEHRIWSGGRAAPGVQIRFVDEHDCVLPDGEIGELVYRGDAFVDAYWNKPQESATAWRGGWFHSGDVGYRDPDGYVYYTDRLFGRIKTGAETVYSREVELVLEKHPAVSEVAVVGLADEHWGQAVTAAVVSNRVLPDDDQKLVEEELADLVRSELARFKVPKRFAFLPALPRTALGKVAYGELREGLESGRLLES